MENHAIDTILGTFLFLLPVVSTVTGVIFGVKFVKAILKKSQTQKKVRYFIISVSLIALGLGIYFFIITHLGAGMSDSLQLEAVPLFVL